MPERVADADRPSPVELVALDVDGTVLDRDGQVAPGILSALSAVRAAGIQVVLATGRALHSTLGVCRILGMNSGYAICSNGAVVADVATGTPVEVATFDPSGPVRYFVEALPDALLAVEELGMGFRVTGEFPVGELSGRITVVPHEELLGGSVTRLVVRWPEGSRDGLLRHAEQAGLHGVAYAIGYTAWLDVMPVGVSKASGLEFVCRRLGVDRSATLAIGDGYNDVEMLGWVGRGIAMGHAPDPVRSGAGEVTGTIDEDGASRVLWQLAEEAES